MKELQREKELRGDLEHRLNERSDEEKQLAAELRQRDYDILTERRLNEEREAELLKERQLRIQSETTIADFQKRLLEMEETIKQITLLLSKLNYCLSTSTTITQTPNLTTSVDAIEQ